MKIRDFFAQRLTVQTAQACFRGEIPNLSTVSSFAAVGSLPLLNKIAAGLADKNAALAAFLLSASLRQLKNPE